jgi:uncharacterized membrane protein YdcZ (DUF606 family)
MKGLWQFSGVASAAIGGALLGFSISIITELPNKLTMKSKFLWWNIVGGLVGLMLTAGGSIKWRLSGTLISIAVVCLAFLLNAILQRISFGKIKSAIL